MGPYRVPDKWLSVSRNILGIGFHVGSCRVGTLAEGSSGLALETKMCIRPIYGLYSGSHRTEKSLDQGPMQAEHIY